MVSMKMDEQLEEEQPSATKPRIDNAEEQKENGSSNNESDLQKSTELKDEAPENSTMDLRNCRHSRPLPLELNCEIFKCLDLLIQRKFIWGLGRGIYDMFSQKLLIKLIKSKRLRNPVGNHWFSRSWVNFTISEDGLNICARNPLHIHNVSAEHGFELSRQYSRMDKFPGTILYYYEVSVLSFRYAVRIGLSSGKIPAHEFIGSCRNSYAIKTGFETECYLAGEQHLFELPDGAIRPETKEYGNTYGCGLVLDPKHKLAIFFTLNGKLLGKQIPITPSVPILFPTVRMWEFYAEANFGNDPAKPFEYDTNNFAGLGLECI